MANRKELGKIKYAVFGIGGYQDAQFGLCREIAAFRKMWSPYSHPKSLKPFPAEHNAFERTRLVV